MSKVCHDYKVRSHIKVDFKYDSIIYVLTRQRQGGYNETPFALSYTFNYWYTVDVFV
jgi:hypothetical protein